MKCLTYEESKIWLASLNIQINGLRYLVLPIGHDTKNVMATLPKGNNIGFFAARLADWLSPDSNRMVWITTSNSFDFQMTLFDKIRLGCGESRTLADAPGHLFEGMSEEETALVSGLMFFMIAFDWWGFFVAENCTDYIYLGDEYMIFYSDNDEKIKGATDLINECKLQVIQNNREAWK